MTSPLSRRQFLTRSGLLAGSLAVAPQLLAGCGGTGADVWFENWPEYIDTGEDGSVNAPGTTVANFTKETHISMKYTEVYNDNNEYFAKIQPLLSRDRAIGPNVLAPTFWMAARLIHLGWLDPLPLSKIPNAKNLIPSLRNPPSDPTGKYSLPWQAGIAGLAYNVKATGREIMSVEDMWSPDLKGRISVLTEMRDTIGLIAMSEGVELKNATFKSLQPAFDKLKEEVDNGQIRQFLGNEYVGPLEEGTLAACFAWSGDVLGMNNPDVRFVVPEAGGTLWFDSMVIPANAPNQADVGEWMNFVYDPVNAAQITAAVQYISPVQGVQDVLRSNGGEDAALADNPLLFPDQATLDRLQTFGNLSDDDELHSDELFARISGA